VRNRPSDVTWVPTQSLPHGRGVGGPTVRWQCARNAKDVAMCDGHLAGAKDTTFPILWFIWSAIPVQDI
jgi:hypothetical protein